MIFSVISKSSVKAQGLLCNCSVRDGAIISEFASSTIYWCWNDTFYYITTGNFWILLWESHQYKIEAWYAAGNYHWNDIEGNQDISWCNTCMPNLHFESKTWLLAIEMHHFKLHRFKRCKICVPKGKSCSIRMFKACIACVIMPAALHLHHDCDFTIGL